MESQLAELSHELTELASRISPCVVAVEGRRRMWSSGVHWRKNLIVTAEHTLRRDEDITIVLPDGKRKPVKLLGRDPGTDLALLQGAGLDFPVVSTTSPAEIRPGQITMIVGRSPNSGPNVSMGIISAISGPWRTRRGGNLDNYIRLDATVFPGSSGGIVVNHEGGIIGIATTVHSRVAGVAIPRSSVAKTVDMLLKHGAVPRGYIGLGLQRVPLPESFQKKLSLKTRQALMVHAVEKGSPAERAGVLVGDILLELDGKPATSIPELQSLLAAETIEKSLNAKSIRGGEIREFSVTIGARGPGVER